MRICKFATFALTGLLMSPWAVSQTVPPAATTAVAAVPTPVPAIVPYSGTVDLSSNKLSASETAVTFLIFKDETGGEPLFTETQTVIFDSADHYKVQLGAVSPNGLPSELFSSGEARWLEVQVTGENPQPRVLLASVPYAMKAADAATLGGLPASAFALAGQNSRPESVSTEVTSNATSNVTTTGGAAGYVPEFSGTASIADSPIFVLGSDIGIGTATPSATLDVAGAALVTGLVTAEGGLTLPATGTATASGGFNSNLLKLYTSAYNSSMKAVVDPRFEWEAVVAGNDTASPSVTLELLSSTSTAGATPTGFSFNSNGTINFASGQTFPGADVTGSVSATSVNANSYDLGGIPFANGSFSKENVFLGFAGPGVSGENNVGVGFQALQNNSSSDNTAIGASALATNTTGSQNVALGSQALINNTGGSYNTASGYQALANNEGSSALLEGFFNTADGYYALFNNVNGQENTAIGYLAGPDIDSNRLEVSTAIGAYATVSEDNALVLGATEAGKPGAEYVNVGIGTPTPRSILEASVSASGALGPALTLTNTAGGLHAASSIDFNTYYHPSVPYNNPTSRIVAIDDNNYGNTLSFLAKIDGADTNGLADNMDISDNGNVTIRGSLSASAKNFKIDDPLDPVNKYLVHSSIESSEMMNIYSGNVTTDELGLATVKLPAWFEAENTDFRYQLTVIGRKAQAWIAEEVGNGQFKIASDATNTKISWQITGVRQDTYAKAHPLVVEQDKPAAERGFTSESPHVFYDHPASAVNRKFAHPAVDAMKRPALRSQLKPSSQVETR